MTPELFQAGLFLGLFIWLIKHTTDVTKIGSRLEQAVIDVGRRLDKIECAVDKLSKTVLQHDPLLNQVDARLKEVEHKVSRHLETHPGAAWTGDPPTERQT